MLDPVWLLVTRENVVGVVKLLNRGAKGMAGSDEPTLEPVYSVGIAGNGTLSAYRSDPSKL